MKHEPTTRYALAALDMDGTLLNSDHALTPYTVDALNRAAAAGKVIALCTGRCLSELWDTFRQAPGVTYAIGENGGCLYDVKAGRLLRQLTLPDARAFQLLETLASYDACVQCFIGGQSYIEASGPEALGPYHVADFAPVFNAGSKYIPDALALARERGGVEKIDVYFADPGDKADFLDRLDREGLFVADSLGYGSELSPAAATKGAGVRALCDWLGIPVQDAMTVGDGGNDIDLVQCAGLGVAMANADPRVMAAADTATDDCDHDGAAKAVLRYMLGEDV